MANEYEYHLTIDIFRNDKSTAPVKSIPVGPVVMPEPIQYGDNVVVFIGSMARTANFGEVYQRIVHPKGWLRVSKSRNFEARTDVHTRLLDNIDIPALEKLVDEFQQ